MRHKERKFKCRTVKKGENYSLMIPERQLFVQLVRFAPGKGPKDYVEFHENFNTPRHKKDIHEIATFLTWGTYDMVVIWDAPNLETYNEFLASWINPSTGFPGTSDTLVGAIALRH
jgi:hypothetical protein